MSSQDPAEISVGSGSRPLGEGQGSLWIPLPSLGNFAPWVLWAVLVATATRWTWSLLE